MGQKLCLLLDFSANGHLDRREVISCLYILTGTTEAERLDKPLALYLGNSDESDVHDIPTKVGKFMRLLAILAMECASSFADAADRLYGNDCHLNLIIDQHTHERISKFANQVIEILVRFMRSRAGSFTPMSTIRRFLDESTQFSKWVSTVATSWMARSAKIAEPGTRGHLRSELANRAKYFNVYSHILAGTPWFTKICSTNRYHFRLLLFSCYMLCPNVFSKVDYDVINQELRRNQQRSKQPVIGMHEAQDILSVAGVKDSVVFSRVFNTFTLASRSDRASTAQFGCGCIMLSNLPPDGKVKLMFELLKEERSDILTLDQLKTMMTAYTKISLALTNSLNDLVSGLSGGRLESSGRNKTQQFRTITLKAVSNYTEGNVRLMLEQGSQRTLDGVHMTAPIFTKWCEDYRQLQAILSVGSEWWQHSLAPNRQATTGGDGINIPLRDLILVVKQYSDTPNDGKKFLHQVSQAMGLTDVAQERLLELLSTDSADVHDLFPVRECAVLIVLLCENIDCRSKLDFVVSLYKLPTAATDKAQTRNVTFVMELYLAMRPFYLAALLTSSAFVSACDACLCKSAKLVETLLSITTTRVGLFIDLLVQNMTSLPNGFTGNWQTLLDERVGHLEWLSLLCSHFSSVMAGVLSPAAQDATLLKLAQKHAMRAFGLLSRPAREATRAAALSTRPRSTLLGAGGEQSSSSRRAAAPPEATPQPDVSMLAELQGLDVCVDRSHPDCSRVDCAIVSCRIAESVHATAASLASYLCTHSRRCDLFGRLGSPADIERPASFRLGERQEPADSPSIKSSRSRWGKLAAATKLSRGKK